MGLIDLRSLQQQVEDENTVENTRNILTEAVTFFASQDKNDIKVKIIFDELRDGVDLDNLKEKEIFFVDPDDIHFLDVPSQYKSYSVGMYNADSYNVYTGRLVYPVRDVKGKVMGLCGWDGDLTPKYLDSKTFGYNAKNNCMYGMEELDSYYQSSNPVFITEGIVCCNYLRSKGFNALALLGSSVSRYVIEILKRFGDRCVLLPDNDLAGLSILKSAKYNLPTARVYVSSVAKDIDDTRKVNNHKYEQELLKELSSMGNPFVSRRILLVQK